MAESRPPAATDHWLVVSEYNGERDYDIEHADSCGIEEWPTGIDEIPSIRAHTCALGQVWEGVGTDSVSDIETVPVGRHPIKVVTEHTPSLPTNGGEEWDVWIEVAGRG